MRTRSDFLGLLLLLLTVSLPANGQQSSHPNFSLLPDVPAEIGLGGPQEIEVS